MAPELILPFCEAGGEETKCYETSAGLFQTRGKYREGEHLRKGSVLAEGEERREVRGPLQTIL